MMLASMNSCLDFKNIIKRKSEVIQLYELVDIGSITSVFVHHACFEREQNVVISTKTEATGAGRAVNV